MRMRVIVLTFMMDAAWFNCGTRAAITPGPRHIG